MIKTQQGMILLTTMVILSLLAAMLFSMQRAVWHQAKLYQHTAVHHEAFDALEAVAMRLAQGMLKATSGERVWHQKKYDYEIKPVMHYQNQWIIRVQAVALPNASIVLRYSNEKGLMSWRYLID